MDTPGLWETHGDPGMGVHRLLSWSQSPQAMVRVTDFTDRRNLQSLLLENSSRTTKLTPKYKQPNLSFPTWRECYSAAATHNKETGAVPTLTFPTPVIILLHFYVLYVCTFSVRGSPAGSRATLWGHLGPCSWFHSPCCCGAASLLALQWVRSFISPFWQNQHISPLPARFPTNHSGNIILSSSQEWTRLSLVCSWLHQHQERITPRAFTSLEFFYQISILSGNFYLLSGSKFCLSYISK